MKRILLIPNTNKDVELKYTTELVEILKRYNCETEILLDSSDNISHINDTADLYIVLGGDGSIMRVSHAASRFGVPILGINLGRVGYMAELEASEFNLIEHYFSGNYRIEERMMLDVTATDEKQHLALNDMVLSNGTVSKMITFDLFNNSDLVRRYNADGIIIATPTGSTAYSMAAGGSIIDPGLNCIAATPVCPHSLSAKSMIFSGDAKLEIKNETDRDIPVFITVDGGDNLEVKYGESVKVCRSDITTKLIRIKNESFYRTLANKME